MKLSLLTALVLVSAVCRAKVVKVAPGIFYESCGPPFNVTIEPNPPKMRHTMTITVEGIAVHDMKAGFVEAYCNTWPFYYKDVYCDDGRTYDPKGCYVSKGEKYVVSRELWIDDYYSERPFSFNMTVRNEVGELMFCTRANATMTFK